MKIFFNSASDFWRMHIDLAKIGASYEGMEEFKVKEGEAVKRAALSVERNPLDLILL